jgi:hypothetical protein
MWISRKSLCMVQVESSYFPQLAAEQEEWTGHVEVDPSSLSIRAGSLEEECSSPDEDTEVSIVTFPSSEEADSTMQIDNFMSFPNFEGAKAFFDATSSAVMGMGQAFFTGPPALFQGSVTYVRSSLVL